ncbi:Non-functional NADPH-dependent codeinone reductase 2-like [Orobanche hederae]
MGIPEVVLNSGYKMPVIALGTASYVTPKAEEVQAILHAIERGYRHFDTAAHYGSEAAVGEAVAEALKRGPIKSRSELFIVSKTWNLKLEYLDLYLIHWPVSLTPGTGLEIPIANKKDIVPFDCKAV